jgi:hypothetical protein
VISGKVKTYPIEDLDKFFDELKEELDQDEWRKWICRILEY